MPRKSNYFVKSSTSFLSPDSPQCAILLYIFMCIFPLFECLMMQKVTMLSLRLNIQRSCMKCMLPVFLHNSICKLRARHIISLHLQQLDFNLYLQVNVTCIGLSSEPLWTRTLYSTLYCIEFIPFYFLFT